MSFPRSHSHGLQYLQVKAKSTLLRGRSNPSPPIISLQSLSTQPVSATSPGIQHGLTPRFFGDCKPSLLLRCMRVSPKFLGCLHYWAELWALTPWKPGDPRRPSLILHLFNCCRGMILNPSQCTSFNASLYCSRCKTEFRICGSIIKLNFALVSLHTFWNRSWSLI